MILREDRPVPLSARSTDRGPVAAVSASIFLCLVALGCQSARGGWDLEALLDESPTIEELDGHRLADMLPFPSFEGDRVVLLACRFPTSGAIRVAGDGPGWPQAWARLAVTALDRGAGGYTLALWESGERLRGREGPEIHVASMGPMDESAPIGLADTLSVCDVSRERGGHGAARGLLLGSRIRIKRARLDWRGLALEATAEEWVGALMHEIGHALGFSGHAVMGHSILVREQSHLRRAGKRALAGEAWHDETLEALYRLPSGQRLGTRRLSADAISTLDGIRELIRRDSLNGSRNAEMRSSVGDWQARVEWLLANGRRLSVRLMHWRDELQSGDEITLLPDATTRRALQRLAGRREESESFVD